MSVLFGQASPLLRGVVIALLGVGFWVGGMAAFYLIWRYYFKEDEETEEDG